MACEFEVLVPAEPTANAAEAALAALDLVEALEAQLTIYRPTGEVARLNQEAHRGPVAIDPGLAELLARAEDLGRETQGAFDITAGALTKAWGFFERAGRVPADDRLAAALAVSGWRHFELDRAAGTVRYRVAGLELNLGAIGKGYALDRAAALLDQAGLGTYLLHGGQSSVRVRSGAQPEGPRQGWTLGVVDPLRPGRRLAQLRLVDRALGTSGSGTQFFREGGRRYGHILDPRTGRPADGVYSATVLAPTAAEADALATALYVLGPVQALDYAARHPEIGVALVIPGGPGGCELVTANLGPDELNVAGE